ncbi:MAG: hypothetical protein ACI9SP_004026 [Arenicella sp.]|jgi:hypothetical protein
MDYTIFYKEELVEADISKQGWDVFISAYNISDRVGNVFRAVSANNKYWLIQKDYDFEEAELPNDGIRIYPDTYSEAKFAKEVVSEINIDQLKGKSICIDITGFIKPYMMSLLYLLRNKGCLKIDVLYSEPGAYVAKEKTKFSGTKISEIKQVAGFKGQHTSDTSNDYLIVGSGYDDNLISHVAENKANTTKVQMFGFPSLRPDMYQENILRAQQASETVDGDNLRNTKKIILAPANDPFVTASELSSFYNKESKNKRITNLYLSPLATKPQALGFTLFYLTECKNKAVSMIYPFSYSHSKETSEGLSRIWKYSLEFEETQN